MTEEYFDSFFRDYGLPSSEELDIFNRPDHKKCNKPGPGRITGPRQYLGDQRPNTSLPFLVPKHDLILIKDFVWRRCFGASGMNHTKEFMAKGPKAKIRKTYDTSESLVNVVLDRKGYTFRVGLRTKPFYDNGA